MSSIKWRLLSTVTAFQLIKTSSKKQALEQSTGVRLIDLLVMAVVVIFSTIILSGCAQPTTSPPLSKPTPMPSQISFSPSVTAAPFISSPTVASKLAPPSSSTPTLTSTPTSTLPAGQVEVLSPLPDSGSTSLVEENKKNGTSDWYVVLRRSNPGEIAGFADATSVNVGESIRFAISTRSEGTNFTLAIYRIGWYGGYGGHLVLKAVGLQGHAQGYWSLETVGVADCPTCVRDNDLGLLDTHWRYRYSLAVPTDWISGEYVVVLTTDQGYQNLIYFVVRQDQRKSDLLVQIPVNTDQAYNAWGGDSLYSHDTRLPPEINGGSAAIKVSFNRPYEIYSLAGDVQSIRFFEKYGYDVTYATSIDIDRDPSILKGHKAFISVGHDEYWTRQMRLNIEQARDAGLNLAFFGGNDLYWQTRLEPDADGNPRRVMVMYRDASLDPLTVTDPVNATVEFIEPPVNWPQNSLTGTIFGGIIEHPSGLPWIVAPTAPAWILANTGLKPGSSVPALTGKECDSVANNGMQPVGLVVVAASPMTTKEGKDIVCNTTYYQTSVGSGVFNAGTLSWTGSMDNFGSHNPGQGEDPRIVQLVINILASFGVNPNK